VSQDRLLTATGYPGTFLTARLPVGLEAIAVGEKTLPAATCPLPAAPESAWRAREFTKITLCDWGMAARVDVAELVVCELVTNSLRHGLLSSAWLPDQHPVGLTLLRRDPYLMCMVTDPEPAGPVPIEASASAESGRGLQVVESCSEAWGWQPVDGAGKVVWALLR